MFLAGAVSKHLLFGGGAATVASAPDLGAEALAALSTPQGHLAWEAYVESAVKAVAALTVSVPSARELVLSGRMASLPSVQAALARRLTAVFVDMSIHTLDGFAAVATQAAQGAALLADGLAGGASLGLVETLGIREARCTVLDHLHVISPATARTRLGIP